MKFYNIFFSPTGGTKKVAEIVAKGANPESEEIDLIKEPDKLMKVKFEKEDLCLVAVPSYGGRIPSVVADMFRNVKADGTKAILAAVFGNRAIDDTLLELQDVLEASGFVCIAGMEAVAEHSLMHQFGTGRPDLQDEKELLEFAAKIMQSSEGKGNGVGSVKPYKAIQQAEDNPRQHAKPHLGYVNHRSRGTIKNKAKFQHSNENACCCNQQRKYQKRN